MRIIAGTARGRALKAPKGPGIRPTADRVRESIFNILGQFFDGSLRVLDLFAGTGALGLEAVSRGAGHATLVDKNREPLSLCRENAAAIGLADKVAVESVPLGDKCEPALARLGQFDLVFADPPYADFGPDEILGWLAASGVVKAGGRVVVEHDKRRPPAHHPGFEAVDTRTFGDTAVTFFAKT